MNKVYSFPTTERNRSLLAVTARLCCYDYDASNIPARRFNVCNDCITYGDCGVDCADGARGLCDANVSEVEETEAGICLLCSHSNAVEG